MNNSLEKQLERFQGDGAYLYIDGKKHIDAASGTFNLPLGYTNDSVGSRIKEQIDRGCHLSSSYTREMSQTLLERLRTYLPKDLSRTWIRDVSGSGAVECAIRMAQKHTGRSGVISFYLSHHGQSLATAQISGNAFRIQNFKVEIPGSIKLPFPPTTLADDSVSCEENNFIDLEQVLEMGTNNNIACLILEPIMGNGGNIVIPQAFYRYIRSFCSKHNIVLIADEVQTCFGRTGTFFASSGYAKELDPDILVFAKGATGIGIPMGGVFMRPELDVLESFEHSSTCGANPLSLVAMDETINVLEKEEVINNVRVHEPFLRECLLKLQSKYDCISKVRGVGYMYAFDTPSVDFANKFIEAASENGLIVRGARYGRGSTVKVRPPLICKKKEIEEISDLLEKTISSFC